MVASLFNLLKARLKQALGEHLITKWTQWDILSILSNDQR